MPTLELFNYEKNIRPWDMIEVNISRHTDSAATCKSKSGTIETATVVSISITSSTEIGRV